MYFNGKQHVHNENGHICIVLGAHIYEPGASPCKVFFFSSEDMNVYSSYSRIFEAEFALKSRGFGDFGSPSGQDKSVKDFVSITYEAQGVLEKNIMS
jgi:hypothetical protein